MSRKRGGQPSPQLLDLKVRDAIFEQVERAVPYEIAAEAAGVSRRTLWDWLRRGDHGDGEEPYATFAAGLMRARARADVMLVEKSLSGGPGSDNARYHFERRNRDLYGNGAPTVAVNVTAPAASGERTGFQFRDMMSYPEEVIDAYHNLLVAYSRAASARGSTEPDQAGDGARTLSPATDDPKRLAP